MPDVTFKDLVLDAHKPVRVGEFWAKLLHQKLVDVGDDEVRLDSGPVMWINVVPEQLGHSRVQLQVRAAGVKGRSTEKDPEGLEWQRFGASETRPFGLAVEALDPLALATWWAERTGAVLKHHGERVHLEEVPGMPYDVWVFTRTSTPKDAKNRMHWDVILGDTTVDGLVALGATQLEVLPNWTVMADPEGNEFCAFPG